MGGYQDQVMHILPRAYGYIDPNFPNPGGPNDASIIIYGYTPSIAVAALAIAIFIIGAIIHGFQVFRYRTWWFVPVFIGTVLEIVGYIFRMLSSQRDPYSVPYFVAQYFLIVVAPVLFSAGLYAILSILIRALSDQDNKSSSSRLPLGPKAILWTFITCDVISTIVQVAGAALVGKAYSNRKDPTTPNNILLGGLAFQCFAFLLFVILGGSFLLRAWGSLVSRGVTTPSFLVATVLATFAVYLRTVFRLAETAQGLEKELSTHEVYFGCLEFAPIVVAVVLLAVWHPGRCVRRASKGAV